MAEIVSVVSKEEEARARAQLQEVGGRVEPVDVGDILLVGGLVGGLGAAATAGRAVGGKAAKIGYGEWVKPAAARPAGVEAAANAVKGTLKKYGPIVALGGAAVSAMGYATFTNFIGEEAMQTAGFAFDTARQAKDLNAMKQANENYKALLDEYKKSQGLAGNIGFPSKDAFAAFVRASEGNYAAQEAYLKKFEANFDNVKRRTLDKIAMAELRDKTKEAKAYINAAVNAGNYDKAFAVAGGQASAEVARRLTEELKKKQYADVKKQVSSLLRDNDFDGASNKLNTLFDQDDREKMKDALSAIWTTQKKKKETRDAFEKAVAERAKLREAQKKQYGITQRKNESDEVFTARVSRRAAWLDRKSYETVEEFNARKIVYDAAVKRGYFEVPTWSAAGASSYSVPVELGSPETYLAPGLKMKVGGVTYVGTARGIVKA
jgi:hypothetical protein